MSIFIMLLTCFSLTACWAEEDKPVSLPKSLSFLVVDLDGDGIELVPLSESDVYFDVDGDGLAERTQWVHPDDGFLYIFSMKERNTLNSTYKRYIRFLVNLLPKIHQYDRDSNQIYTTPDYKQLPRDQTFRELGFYIFQDKGMKGIHETKDKYRIPCDFEAFSFADPQNMIIKCKEGKSYTVSEVVFDYEDSNVRWDSMCKMLRNSSSKTEDTIQDYREICTSKAKDISAEALR